MKFKTTLAALFSIMLLVVVAHGQGKGVDTQSSTIRDNGNSGTSGINGGTQRNGTAGSGIDFGAGKTKSVPALPNPYRLTARRDVMMNAIAD